MPRVDMFSNNGAILVNAEIPGVSKDALDVSVEDGMLVIDGERTSKEKIAEADYYRQERSFGSFRSQFPLPDGVKTEAIEATFADGVLRVTIPTSATPEEPKPVKVAIK